jgi:hypothetical protein
MSGKASQLAASSGLSIQGRNKGKGKAKAKGAASSGPSSPSKDSAAKPGSEQQGGFQVSVEELGVAGGVGRL